MQNTLRILVPILSMKETLTISLIAKEKVKQRLARVQESFFFPFETGSCYVI